MKILRRLILGVAAVVLIAAILLFILSERALKARPAQVANTLATPTAEQLANAPRQLRVLGCVGCHGEGLRGDLYLDEPGVATLYAPNLTVLAAQATDRQLDQGIRQGIGHDGRSLLIMPSEGYQFLSDSEAAALIAAIRSLPTAGQQQPPPSIGLMARLGLALGEFHPAPALVRKFRQARIPEFGPQFDRGRHIVQVNCGECHGPQLRGQEVEPGVVAPDLEIAGAYEVDQFRAMMRTGIGPGGKDIGLMGRIAKRDFAHMTDEEIDSVHAYLAERSRRLP